ncbi:MAG: sigma-70 family RNA polymerase sigma factor [Acidobacteriota bacterium]|nr:sigma-70 family RNA polymerase sigma factor [Acidobacteriota bacterium]
MPPAGDLELIAAILRRDRKATAEFVALHIEALYGYVRHRLFPRGDLIEDLVQEVFLAAWQQLPLFRGESTLRNWLLGIARHKVEDHYRAQLRHFDAWPEDGDEVPPELQFDPCWDDDLDREALQRRTRLALDGLPEDYRFILLWRYWDKRSTKEMASLTGRTEKGVERLLAHAREQFKRRWDDE